MHTAKCWSCSANHLTRTSVQEWAQIILAWFSTWTTSLTKHVIIKLISFFTERKSGSIRKNMIDIYDIHHMFVNFWLPTTLKNILPGFMRLFWKKCFNSGPFFTTFFAFEQLHHAASKVYLVELIYGITDCYYFFFMFAYCIVSAFNGRIYDEICFWHSYIMQYLVTFLNNFPGSNIM